MTDLAVVPQDEGDDAGQLDIFEGKVVSSYRIRPGSIPEFASIDPEGNAMKLMEGDVVVVQVEAVVTNVDIGAAYKGGIPWKARKRTHVANVVDGSQQVVHVHRRPE